MWSLKFKVLNKDSIYTLLTENYKVTDFLYPVDFYRKKGRVYILAIHVLEGEEHEKKKFIRALKKNRKIKNFEENNSQIITLIAEEESFYDLLFAAELYHPAPVIIRGGYEQWHVSSFNRAVLERLIREIESWKDKFPEFKLQSLAKTRISEIYFPKIKPQLSVQQQRAFDSALKRGYYAWPRKVSLGKLAKELHLSVATFHEHLRKAEANLMPLFAA
jgi:predicted DNA binding protein